MYLLNHYSIFSVIKKYLYILPDKVNLYFGAEYNPDELFDNFFKKRLSGVWKYHSGMLYHKNYPFSTNHK